MECNRKYEITMGHLLLTEILAFVFSFALFIGVSSYLSPLLYSREAGTTPLCKPSLCPRSPSGGIRRSTILPGT